jgi:hypothetical protein
MSPETILLLLLVLACPVGMMFMMRGGGHSSHGMQGMRGMRDDNQDADEPKMGGHESSLEDLRAQRTALDDEIARREITETTRTKQPVDVP